MPIYTMKNLVTGEISDMTMSMSEREEFLKNSDYVQILKPVAFGDSFRLGVTKVPDGFKDVLKKAKTAHPLGNIDA